MDRQELLRELEEVEKRMKLVDPQSRAYRAGVIVREHIMEELAKLIIKEN